MNLNPQQLEAVHHTEGPLLILAGAGTGKTRVIINRIAHLVRSRQLAPWNILAVTFTNKAAEEMRTRLFSLLGTQSREMWMTTFHSCCVRILRNTFRESTPEWVNFAIYDGDDSMTLIKQVLEELKIDDKTFSPRTLYARIEAAKNELIDPQSYQSGASDFFESRVAEIYQLYQKKLDANRALDFGDLIFRTVQLFRQNPRVLGKYQDLFRYILIDEYQDTNRAQYILTRLLAEKNHNLCVVGDDDQSIYRWRGADLNNILNFEADFPGCRVIRLEQNYRSTQNILNLANAVISHNTSRKGKSLWTGQAVGEKALVYQARDDREEASFVAETIEKLVLQGRRYNDCAIFYRTNAQSRVIEDELCRRRIPYMIFGGVRFYDRKEVKDILAYLRVLVNPQDSLTLKRILNVPPRGLGKKTVEALENFSSECGIPLFEALQKVGDIRDVPTAARGKLQEFFRLMENFRQGLKQSQGLSGFVQKVIEETGYAGMLRKENTVESEGRLENLGELINGLVEFERTNAGEATLDLFLDQVALVGQTDTLDPEKGVLPLMTFHLAKGLEFPVVFMVGMEEGLFPHSRSLDEPEELEEERRLCYVGLTRAREKIFLTLANSRRHYGEEQFNLPSRFLEEMPAELVERMEAGPSTRLTPPRDFKDNFFDQRPFEEMDSGETFRVGTPVHHSTFGHGVVKRHEGRGEQEKVTVYFQNGLVKVLVVKFANLSVQTPQLF